MVTLSDLKSVADVLRNFDKLPEMEKILDFMGQLSELQVANGKLTEEVRACKGELQARADDSLLIATLSRDGDYLRDDSGNPYCVHCAMVDKRIGPLVTARDAKGSGFTQCSRCKQTYYRFIR